MTKPIIYQLAYSPYCIPITQALSAVGQEFETREVPNWERGEILKLTNGSYYQVPVIQFEDRIVYESGTDTLDVARFVDEEFGQNKLFPKKFEGLQQIIVPYIENDVEGTTFKILDSYYLMTFEDVRARGMMIRHGDISHGLSNQSSHGAPGPANGDVSHGSTAASLMFPEKSHGDRR